MENFKRVHDSIKPPVSSPASSPNLSESSLARWAAVLYLVALTLGPFGLATRALTDHPPNWIQTNLTTRRLTKPAGLIESCIQGVGAPPQTPGRLRRTNVAGGSALRHPLGSAQSRWDSDPKPVQEGVLGAGTPSGVRGAALARGAAEPQPLEAKMS